jgi:hypothetical protein
MQLALHSQGMHIFCSADLDRRDDGSNFGIFEAIMQGGQSKGQDFENQGNALEKEFGIHRLGLFHSR